MEVVEIMQPGEKDAILIRAIGTTLCELRWENGADAELQEKIDKEGVEHLEKCVALLEGRSLVKSATLRLLAERSEYPSRGEANHDKAISYLDEAIEAFPDLEIENLTEKKKKDWNYKKIQMRLEKGRILRNKDDLDAALGIYNEAREASIEPLDGWELQNITNVFDEKKDPDGSGLMNTLKSWTNKERNNWLDTTFFYDPMEDSVKRLNRAAKLTNQIDLLLEWLTGVERASSAQDGLKIFNIQAAIANIHQVLLGDVEKAKQIRHDMLSTKIRVWPWQEDILPRIMTNEWMRYAGIIFSQFHSSPDPLRKETFLEELKKIPRVHVSDELYESHVGMLVANMLRVMGPARGYYEYLDNIFQACMSGLEDSVSYNDAPSLRLLAKVLASLDGLERDAQIAYSLQFSILDREIHENGKDKEKDKNSSDETPAADLEGDAKKKGNDPEAAEQADASEKPVEANKEEKEVPQVDGEQTKLSAEEANLENAKGNSPSSSRFTIDADTVTQTSAKREQSPSTPITKLKKRIRQIARMKTTMPITTLNLCLPLQI